MYTVIVLVLQLVALAFLGGFSRTQNSISDYSYLTPNLLMVASWALMYSPHKKLSLHPMMLSLVIIAIAFEAHVLFGVFWSYCYNGFSGSFDLGVRLLMEASYSALAVLLVCMDFIGIFLFWQVYLILVLTVAFGFALNSATLRYGLNIFDAGGASQIFAFSGAVSLAIWALCVRGKIDAKKHQIENHYVGNTLTLFGLAACFILWPSFNRGGAMMSAENSNIGQQTSVGLQNSAYTNTLFCVCVGLSLALIFMERDGTFESKTSLKSYIDCFVSAGISCSAFADVALNPSAGMAVACLSSLLTLLFYRYLQREAINPRKRQDYAMLLIVLEHYSRVLFRLLASFISVITCSIILKIRQDLTPSLLSTANNSDIYSLTAGLEIVGYLISVVLGAVSGGLTGFLINLFMAQKRSESAETVEKQANEQLTDFQFFDDLLINNSGVVSSVYRHEEQLFPLYLKKHDIYVDEHLTARKVIREHMLSHLKNNQITRKPADDARKVRPNSSRVTHEHPTGNMAHQPPEDYKVHRKPHQANKSQIIRQEIPADCSRSLSPSANLLRSHNARMDQGANSIKIYSHSQSDLHPVTHFSQSNYQPSNTIHESKLEQSNNKLRDSQQSNGHPDEVCHPVVKKSKGLLITSEKPEVRVVEQSISQKKIENLVRKINYESSNSSDIGNEDEK